MKKLFCVWATDRPGVLDVRNRVREEHRRRLRDPAPHRVKVVLGGPTLCDGAETMNGSLLIVEAESFEAVRAFVDDDPYTLSEVYADVEIRPWRQGLGPDLGSAEEAPTRR